MELEIKNENGILIIKIIGKLNTMTAPKLEEVISNNLQGINTIIFDLEELKYISSSGIRILVATNKKISEMKLLKPKEEVMEVFEITGLSDKFNIVQ